MGVLLRLGSLQKLPVVQPVEHPWVDGGKLLHGQVDGVKAPLQTVKQQPGDTGGDGRGGVGLDQLGQGQPLAAQTLLSAEVDVVGEGAESADNVHVRHAEGARVVVLLPDTEQRPELRANARLLVDLPDRGGIWKKMVFNHVRQKDVIDRITLENFFNGGKKMENIYVLDFFWNR